MQAVRCKHCGKKIDTVLYGEGKAYCRKCKNYTHCVVLSIGTIIVYDEISPIEIQVFDNDNIRQRIISLSETKIRLVKR